MYFLPMQDKRWREKILIVLAIGTLLAYFIVRQVVLVEDLQRADGYEKRLTKHY
jgi:uncharacterized protein YpmS